MKPSAKIRVLVWMGIALIHFGASNLILPLTTALVNRFSGAGDGPGLAVTLLVRATRLLHVPLVTLALYPREWFPGNWIYLPMAANSLIWATGICWLIRVFRRPPDGMKRQGN
jgi:hypothetical protein